MSQKKIKKRVTDKKVEQLVQVAKRMFARRIAQRGELLKRVTLASREDQQEEREEEESEAPRRDPGMSTVHQATYGRSEE